MFGSGRPDGTAVRARLRATSPRWVPSEADLIAATQRAERPVASTPIDELHVPADGSELKRHALPEAPRATWKLNAAALRGLLSLGLAAAAGALVMVVMGWPRGSAVEPEVSDHGRVSNVLTEPTPSAESAALVVDVDGNVDHPGVVELPEGSRIFDAIKAAGGLTRHGDTGDLNLAEVLIDGQQVVVPSESSTASSSAGGAGDVAGGSTPAPTTATVSVNSASPTELETLPGIGPVLAAAIVEWRTQNGGFTSIEQLQEVSGIGPTTYAELAPLVRL